MSKTRRDAMRTIVLGAAASVAVAPQAFSAAPAITDHHLIELERRFDVAAAACREAHAALGRAKEQALAVWPVVPKSIRLGGSPRSAWAWAPADEKEPFCFISEGWGYENGVRQNYTMRSVSNLHALHSNIGHHVSRRRRSEKSIAKAAACIQRAAAELAEGERFHAECQAIRERFDVNALAEARQASWDALRPVVVAIGNAQAQTFSGLAIKAKVMCDEDARRASVDGLLLTLPRGIAEDILWMAARN